MAHITSDGTVTKIEGLVSEDRSLAQLLAAHPSADWPEVIERALSIGARGLLSMGIDLGLDGVRSEVRRQVEEANSASEQRVAEMLSEAEKTITEQLDPDRRTSLLSRSLREFHQWHSSLRSLDVALLHHNHRPANEGGFGQGVCMHREGPVPPCLSLILAPGTLSMDTSSRAIPRGNNSARPL